MSHPILPYILNPSYGSHNSYGFRGKEFSTRKEPEKKRIVCMGASTTYGFYVEPEETYPARLERLLLQNGIDAEVINAGVPGWISTDNLLNLQLRILPLQPDLIIVYQGRNELFPQSFNNFSPDYSHYRDADYCFKTTNYLHKPLFSISHLFMILSVYKGDRFWWSSREENPLYGSIRYENQPTDSQLIKNLNIPIRSSVYRETVRSIVSLCMIRNMEVILATMAVRVEDFATGVLKVPPKHAPNNDHDPAIYDAMQRQVEENNQIVRGIAHEYGVTVAETASLVAEPELFLDDCHFNEKGHARRAAIIFEAISKNGLLGIE